MKSDFQKNFNIQLKTIKIEVFCSSQPSIDQLRLMIREKLIEYGEPLRWAITSTAVEQNEQQLSRLNIEAVVVANLETQKNK